MADLQAWVKAGKIKVQEDIINGLENTPQALNRIARRREPRQADGEDLIATTIADVRLRPDLPPRHCEEHLREAIQFFLVALDCFASLAMTEMKKRGSPGQARR